jgi:hypothetical protein
MSNTRKIALIATLATLVAAPAFAQDEEVAAATVNSGRYFGQQVNVSSGAYASAYAPARQGNAHIGQPAVEQHDFQLDGRGLGE